MLKRALKAIFGNFLLKASALIISVGIWFYASRQVNDELVLRAVLDIQPPPEHALLFQSDQVSGVSLAGPRSVVSKLRKEWGRDYVRLSYTLTAEEASEGLTTLTVAGDWLQLDLPEREAVQLRLQSITPSTVQVVASPLLRKRLPVLADVDVQTSPGFVHASPVCEPAAVTVRGPRLALDGLDSLRTSQVRFFGVRSDQETQVRVIDDTSATLPNGSTVPVALEVEPASVTVKLHVTGEPEQERVFENVQVLWQVPPGFPYVPEFTGGQDRVRVVVTGPRGALAKLQPQDIGAYVDLVGLGSQVIAPGTDQPCKERVGVRLPQHVEFRSAQAQPDQVTFRLKNPAP